MWGHYHPNDRERDETECRLFELTKNISNYGIGRLVYNKYEMSYDSENYDLLNDNKDPETFWVSFDRGLFWGILYTVYNIYRGIPFITIL